MTESKAVRDALLEFTRAALRLIAERTRSGFPTQPEQRVDFSTPHTLSASWFDVPAAYRVVSDLRAELAALPQARAAVEALARDGTLVLPEVLDGSGRPVPPEGAVLHRLVEERLRDFISDYIEACGSLELRDECFERVHAEYQMLWHSGCVTREVVVPLIWFVTDEITTATSLPVGGAV